MFYGVPVDRRERFEESINYIVDTYDKTTFAGDNLISVNRNLSFLRDERFTSAFHPHVGNSQDQSLTWRLHVLTWAATHAQNVVGDYVECGVDRGFSTAVICRYLDFGAMDKSYYLYDTFSGPPEQFFSQAKREASAKYYRIDKAEENLQRVRQLFSVYRNVRIVRGVLPESLADSPQQIAMLHVDLASAEAEVATLEALFDRVSPGGIIILQAYGHSFCYEIMKAHDRFFESRGYKVLELPTGQGMVLKR